MNRVCVSPIPTLAGHRSNSRLRALYPSLLAIALAVPVSMTWGQTTASIDRIKPGDGELSCAQIHSEINQMERLVVEAQASESKDRGSASTASAAGTVAEIAGRTGLFGALGGVAGALLGQTAAQVGAGAVEKSAQDSAQRMADRARQGAARKEHLTAMFLARECKQSDLSASGKPISEAEMQKLMAQNADTAKPSPDTAVVPPPADGVAAAALLERLAATTQMGVLPQLSTVGAGGSNVRTVVAKAPHVVVAAFRVAFADKTGTAAFGTGSRSSAWNVSGTVKTHTIKQSESRSLKLELENVNVPLMQAITDRLHADFIEQLKGRGLEVLPRQVLDQSQHFTSRIRYSKPKEGLVYTVSPTGDPRNYNVLPASGVPLFFLAADPFGDQGLINLEQMKGLMFSSLDTRAVALIVQLTIDFAETSSSGRSRMTNTAEVDGRPVISLVGGRGNYVTALHSTNTIMGEWGSAAIEEPFFLDGDYATVRSINESSDTLNAVSTALTVLTATPGLIQRSERRIFSADPARYSELALKAGLAANRALVAAVR